MSMIGVLCCLFARKGSAVTCFYFHVYTSKWITSHAAYLSLSVRYLERARMPFKIVFCPGQTKHAAELHSKEKRLGHSRQQTEPITGHRVGHLIISPQHYITMLFFSGSRAFLKIVKYQTTIAISVSMFMYSDNSITNCTPFMSFRLVYYNISARPG